MSDWEIVRHQAAIAGRVTDAQTGQPIGGAQVEITDAPAEFKTWLAMRAIQYGDRWAALAERPDRTRTAADGHFHFLDLPDGDYTLVASLPGAGTRRGVAQVAGRMVTGMDLTLTPTTEPEPKPAPELAPPSILAALSKPAPLPEFKPTQIPGCQLWLTAEAVTGLRDGDPLAVWPDRSGYDHHAVQTEKQKRPTYQAQGIGRQPAVRFAGAEDSMTLEFSEASTDHTFFFAYDQPTPGKHNNFLFDAQAGRLTLDSAQAASPHRIRWQDSIWHSVTEAMTGPQILTWVFSSTTAMAEVLRNGTSLGTDDYIPRSLAGKMTLGPNRSDQYSRLAGSMAAVIYYNRALTPEERQQVEQYLSKRFGISLD